MYADKLKEALAILEDLQLFLESRQPQAGMTQNQAEGLAATIKARLPQAEVETREDEQQRAWVVEARNPRRGTSHIFRSPEEFEELLQASTPRHPTHVEP
jgi:hypothetical protein